MRRWSFHLSLAFGPEQDEHSELIEDKVAYTQAEQAPDYHEPELHLGFRGSA